MAACYKLLKFFFYLALLAHHPWCQGMVHRSGAGSVGYSLGVPERAGSPAMGGPPEGELSGSVCSGSDTHNSMSSEVSSNRTMR